MIRNAPDLRDCDVTDRNLYLRRREFIGAAAAGAGLGLLGAGAARAALPPARKSPFSTDEKLTPKKDITSYNNFYEFGVDKGDPERYAGRLTTKPWTVTVDGLCAKPSKFYVEDLIKHFPLEERIYRMRCVEAWSMVIPWTGFPLASLLKAVEPTSKAKFVAFETVLRPAEMPGQRQPILDWPYKEGLRLDEAMNPLTLVTVGLYGDVLPNQDGAPIRIVTPWKYGFKSAKSIVRISLVDRQPPTAWNLANASEYGFYSNVNPEVNHPRWSQATERRIGELFRRKTLPFNGYGEQVASLYKGMDLRRYY